MREDAELAMALDGLLDDAVLEALAVEHAEAPPPTLAARLATAVAADARVRQTRASLVRWRVVGSIAATLAIVLGGLALRASRLADERGARQFALVQENAALTDELAAQARTVATLRAEVAAQGGVLRVLAVPRPLVATLAPQDDGPARGRVLLDAASGQTAVVLAGLDPALDRRVYELWAIRGERAPEPAGLLAVAADGTAVMRVDAVARATEVTAFAVSIEPIGGSTSPTGPIVLVGAVTAG